MLEKSKLSFILSVGKAVAQYKDLITINRVGAIQALVNNLVVPKYHLLHGFDT